MSSSPRRQGSRYSRSRSASNVSFRSSRSSSYRNAAQQTSDTGHRSPRRQRSSSPTRPNSTRSRTPSPSRPAPRKRFGLNVPTNQPRFVGKFDFEEKYPEDPINQEMGPNARVWRAFLDECEVFDADMVTEARDGLDLHLVFAGLFSAVLTTFVAQTSQALSTNFPALSTSLLIEMVALQRAQVNNTPIDTIPSTATTSGPSGFDIWVNALWFTSLALSLGTALITVLVKQWLYQYMSMISGTARDRSLIRHYRFDGLQRWHVLTIPVLLHIALGLFLAGLVIFLIPLHIPLACVIGFITVVIYTMYIVSNILPLVYTHCPYRTPFSDILNILMHPIRTLPLMVRERIHNLFSSVEGDDDIPPSSVCMPSFRTLKEAERIVATDGGVAEAVACSAVLWLHQMTSNLPTKEVVQESLGCLSATVSERLAEVDQGEFPKWRYEVIHENYEDGPHCLIVPGQERRAERLLRGSNAWDPHMRPKRWLLDPNAFELPFQMVAVILARHPTIVVEVASQIWNQDRLLVYLIQQGHRHHHLPSILWARLISSAYTDGVPQLTGTEDNMFLLSLCRLATFNFSSHTPQITPFSGPVSIIDARVPLFQFAVDLIAARLGNVRSADSFDSEPLTKLFAIYGYAMSCFLLKGSNHEYDIALSVLAEVWNNIVYMYGLSENDTHTVGQRAENFVLQNLTVNLEDGWCDSSSATLHCYSRILAAYSTFHGSHVTSPKFFKRLVSDFCASLMTATITSSVSSALQRIFYQHTNVPVYCTIFTAAPFLSSRTLTSLSCFRECLYPVVASFISCFTGVNMPREAALRCMGTLSADSQCLYTVCRVIALGNDVEPDDPEYWKKDLKQHLLKLVRFDPTHVVWTQRVHYMSMDPQDWPYLRLLDEELNEEAKVAKVRECMKIGLAILDEFFISYNHPPQATLCGAVFLKRIRRFAWDIGRVFRPSLSDVADMELGLQTSGGPDHSRHSNDTPPHTSHQPQNTFPLQCRESRSSMSSHGSLAEVTSGESSHPEVHTQMISPARPSSNISNVQTGCLLDPYSGPLTEHQPSEEVSDESSSMHHSANPDVDGIVQAMGASHSVPSNPLEVSTDIV